MLIHLAAPAIFYPFRSAAGDTEHFLTGDESYESVALSTPYTFFGRTYNSLYVRIHSIVSLQLCKCCDEQSFSSGFDLISHITGSL